MADDFAPLEQLVDGLLEALEPGPRRKLAGAIASDLRTANAKRIKANVTPDGAPMVPRKGPVRKGKGPSRHHGSAKGGKSAEARQAKLARMFQRAAGPSILRREATEDEARVGYSGAMARVMAVHQYGLRDHVTREPGSPEVTYAARPLIGMTADDKARVLAQVLNTVTAG